MRSGALALACLLTGLLACATPEEAAPPPAQARSEEPGELIDCSVEYGALPSARSYVRAFNDVAGSYMSAQRLHERLRRDPTATSKQVEEAWRARVGAAQTLLRACRCWEQLDRLAYTGQVLAAQNGTTKKLKAEVGRDVAVPCQKVFEAEAAGR
jgi:hypothetical protein